MNGRVIWIIGPSGSGKSSIVKELKKEYSFINLDGDDLRGGAFKDLGYDDISRLENVRRTAEIARIISEQGCDVICTLMAPTYAMRVEANKIVPAYWIMLDCPVSVCAARDTKGLYRRNVSNLSGQTSSYETTMIGLRHMRIRSYDMSIQESAKMCAESISIGTGATLKTTS